MDSLINAAGRALAAGDPVGALKLVALRNDAPALALRGTAMAQMGDFARSRSLLRAAARAFGEEEPMARARCTVAEAEVALASRDLAWDAKGLAAARAVLVRKGDRSNAALARYLEVRRWLLMGRLEEAERALATLDAATLPAALRTAHELVLAGIAIRRVRANDARAALIRAEQAARVAGIPALWGEVDVALRILNTNAARRLSRGCDKPLRLDDVEALFASRAFIVDACRLTVRQESTVIPLASRPVLFALARALAESWPSDVARDVLVQKAFRLKRADETLRARLRVEIGRLRRVLKPIADISATPHGFCIEPRRGDEVVVLALNVEEEYATVLAMLADGEQWSSSALGLALGQSQRTVQRALDDLASAGKVQSLGRGRARRWITPPLPGFATSLLLPMALTLE